MHFVQTSVSYLVAHVSSADSPSRTSTLASPTVTDTSPFAANVTDVKFLAFENLE